MGDCHNGITSSKIREESNTRLYDRNIPSQMLQPYLDSRPVMTKYSYLPIVDPRRQGNAVPLTKMPEYNPHRVFNPGNAMAPWSGFSSNVNKESELRNQIYALQSCSQAVYVPSSNSDLYHNKFQLPKVHQPHELLFETHHFSHFNPNPNKNNDGTQIFMSSTRGQVKEMTKINNNNKQTQLLNQNNNPSYQNSTFNK